MNDSYGDGWNGGYLEIGGHIFELEGSASGTETFVPSNPPPGSVYEAPGNCECRALYQSDLDVIIGTHCADWYQKGDDPWCVVSDVNCNPHVQNSREEQWTSLVLEAPNLTPPYDMNWITCVELPDATQVPESCLAILDSREILDMPAGPT
eukprot:UN21979